MDISKIGSTCQAYGLQGSTYTPEQQKSISGYLSPSDFAQLAANATNNDVLPFLENGQIYVASASGNRVCINSYGTSNGQPYSANGCYDVRGQGDGTMIYCKKSSENVVTCSSRPETCASRSSDIFF